MRQKNAGRVGHLFECFLNYYSKVQAQGAVAVFKKAFDDDRVEELPRSGQGCFSEKDDGGCAIAVCTSARKGAR